MSSRRKLNKLPHLRVDPSRATSESQLHDLANAMGMTIQTGRITDLPKLTGDKLILNLDHYGPGTHWVAIDRQKKEYFDPYSYERPKEVPRGLKIASGTRQLQSLDAKDCGLLCLTWLYAPRSDEFMKMFKDVYHG